MNIYRIKSDILYNSEEFVVADSMRGAIEAYVEKYADQYVKESSITSIERIAEDCLFSQK